MKILFIARGYPKLENKMLGIFERDQALAIKKLGHEVAYVVLDLRSIRRKRKMGYNRFCDSGIPVYEMNIPLGDVPLKMRAFFEDQAIRKLMPRIEQEWGTPDIVHAHFYKMAVGICSFFHNKGIPVVLTEHSSVVNKGKMSEKEKSIVLETYHQADEIIAVSNPLSRTIYAEYGVQCKVVPNIVSLHEMVEYKPHGKVFNFVSAANLLRGKGFDLLIKAMSRVVKDFPDVRLTIYGDGPCRKEYENMIEKFGLSQNVTLYGRYERNELPEKYAEADAFVLASRGETFGVVYIEAMACGLPVIGTICGGPEDFINKDVGLLVPKEDVDQLASAMMRMIQNITSYDRRYISNYALSCFSSERVADMILKVYQNIIQKRCSEQT